MMTDEFKGWCAGLMNKLPFVRWDRCTLNSAGSGGVAFGWIDREDDGKADFVVLLFLGEQFGFTTSSAKYSREISKALLGTDDGHRDCERVEDVFGDMVANKVCLSLPPCGGNGGQEARGG